MMRRYNKPIKRRVSRIKKCVFCVAKAELDYKDTETIRRYISERGKIVARVLTGICQKHQRQLTVSIKRARHLALLPFIVKPS